MHLSVGACGGHKGTSDSVEVELQAVIEVAVHSYNKAGPNRVRCFLILFFIPQGPVC